MTLTDEEIEEIKARAEAATPGPWRRQKQRGYTDDYILTDHPDHQTKPHGNYIGEVGYAAGHAVQNFEADADFIAHARTDIPALLSALEAEKKRADEAEALAAARRVLEGGKRDE